MSTAKVTISVDEAAKDAAQAVFDELGMSFSTGVELYLRAVARNQGIPFGMTLRPVRSEIIYSVVPLPADDDVS